MGIIEAMEAVGPERALMIIVTLSFITGIVSVFIYDWLIDRYYTWKEKEGE